MTPSKRARQMIGIDLSQSPPLVTVGGAVLAGVSRATVDILPGEVVVLVVRLVQFEITGGRLPFGMHAPDEGGTER
jgi:hypothetical protein